MQFQRISPNQLIVSAPVEEVREAVWYALRESRVNGPVIDVEQNVVAGSTGDGFLTVARSVMGRLVSQAGGVSVIFEAKPVLGGTIDFGASKKAAAKVADSLERILNAGFTASGIVEQQPSPGMAAPPIALATGGGAQTPFAAYDRPVYGRMLAPKRGGTLLSYSIFGLLCCQILSLFTVFYSISALRDYNAKGDPGDKGLVIASLCISGVTPLLLLLRIILIASQ